MKRELEFKGWNTKTKEMYSSAELVKDELTLLTDGRFINVSGAAHTLSRIYEHIIPLQYLGASDSKGNRLFEGDIIEADLTVAGNGLELVIGVIEYTEYEYVIVTNLDDWPVASLALMTSCTILGNMYQNPELMEKHQL